MVSTLNSVQGMSTSFISWYPHIVKPHKSNQCSLSSKFSQLLFLLLAKKGIILQPIGHSHGGTVFWSYILGYLLHDTRKSDAWKTASLFAKMQKKRRMKTEVLLHRVHNTTRGHHIGDYLLLASRIAMSNSYSKVSSQKI